MTPLNYQWRTFKCHPYILDTIDYLYRLYETAARVIKVPSFVLLQSFFLFLSASICNAYSYSLQYSLSNATMISPLRGGHHFLLHMTLSLIVRP